MPRAWAARADRRDRRAAAVGDRRLLRRRLRRRHRVPLAVLDRPDPARSSTSRSTGGGRLEDKTAPRRRPPGPRRSRQHRSVLGDRLKPVTHISCLLHRRRFDAQPTTPCEVMLASDGRQDYSPGAVARAAALAGSKRSRSSRSRRSTAPRSASRIRAAADEGELARAARLGRRCDPHAGGRRRSGRRPGGGDAAGGQEARRRGARPAAPASS